MAGTMEPDELADLAKERWRLFLSQWAAEFADERGNWQSGLAGRLGVTPSAINKQARFARGKRPQTIQRAIARLQIDPDFFYNPRLKDPHWRDFVRKKAPEAAAENKHWQRFVRYGWPEKLKLTDEEIGWLRATPFRGGPQSVDDYIGAAEVLFREALKEPT